MRKFKDACEPPREWKISLSYGLMQKIKEDLSIDLLDIRKADSLQRLTFDIASFVNLLFVCCEEQAKSLGVSDEDFGRGLGGDVFDDAFQAFQDEYIDFFPKSQRAILRTALGKMSQTAAEAVNLAMEEIESPQTTQAMNQKLSSLRTSIRGAIDTGLKD